MYLVLVYLTIMVCIFFLVKNRMKIPKKLFVVFFEFVWLDHLYYDQDDRSLFFVCLIFLLVVVAVGPLRVEAVGREPPVEQAVEQIGMLLFNCRYYPCTFVCFCDLRVLVLYCCFVLTVAYFICVIPGQNFDLFFYIWVDYEFPCLVSRQWTSLQLLVFVVLWFAFGLWTFVFIFFLI